MDVLVACEYSGIVRDAFTNLGHNAISCDFLESEKPGHHYLGDVRDIIFSKKWDIVIAHPPCTMLCNSVVRWLYNRDGSINQDRWYLMVKAAEFFKWFLELPFPFIAVENPIMHKHAAKIIGMNAAQFIHPWEHGHGETKATGLWLKGLPKIVPTNVVDGREHRVWKLSQNNNGWKERSRTFPGIASAMATQWSDFLK